MSSSASTTGALQGVNEPRELAIHLGVGRRAALFCDREHRGKTCFHRVDVGIVFAAVTTSHRGDSIFLQDPNPLSVNEFGITQGLLRVFLPVIDVSFRRIGYTNNEGRCDRRHLGLALFKTSPEGNSE